MRAPYAMSAGGYSPGCVRVCAPAVVPTMKVNARARAARDMRRILLLAGSGGIHLIGPRRTRNHERHMPTYTLIHVVISLAGIASGLVVLAGMLAGKRLNVWTAMFLTTTVLT